MSIKNKKGFTLIELVAVLVIMAIIALIVTPLVMSIIRKAKIAADKRSVDAYGRSIELAIAGYLMDTGSFPTSIEQLTIEYSGDEVVCSTTQLNGDSSVYLTGCTVGGRSVDYTYGTDKTPPAPTYTAYSVGDEVSYNNVDYYVIADSGTADDTVTLLKAEPLTVSEVNQYGGVGTANNHVNMYVTSDTSASHYQSSYDIKGDGSLGGMAYYSSLMCGYNGSDWISDECINSYEGSEIKYVVDAWKTAKVPAAIEVRLITIDDLESLKYEWHDNGSSGYWLKTESTPNFVYNSNYWYWTGISEIGSSSDVRTVGTNGDTYPTDCGGINSIYSGAVRPVIVLPKSVLN